MCFFEDAVDLLVNGFDVVLLDAEHTVRDARTVFVGEVKGAEGLRSGNELGSVGKVAGAEGRVVGEGNVDFGEVASDGGSVPDCHLSIKIIKTRIISQLQNQSQPLTSGFLRFSIDYFLNDFRFSVFQLSNLTV